MQIFADDDVHHPQSERRIRSRIDRQIPVGARRGARAIRINHHELRAIAPRLRDERPQVHVVAVNVRGPRNDVLGMFKLLRLRPELLAVNGNQACFPSLRTDRAIELRSSEPVKESPVHGAAIEHSQSSAKGIGKNGLAPELRRDAPKARGNLVESLVPRNAPPGLCDLSLCDLSLSGFCLRGDGRPRLSMRSEAPLPNRRPFRGNPPHRIQHPVR